MRREQKATKYGAVVPNCLPMQSAFSAKLNITQYKSALLKPKIKYVESQNNALGKIQARYFFAQIRASPILFERKKSNRTEDTYG